MNKPHLLVLGARANSLGHAVANAANEWGTYETVTTAGISGDEDLKADVTNQEHIKNVLTVIHPDHIVCTVGVNEPGGMGNAYLPSIMTDSFRTNVIAPMEVLRHWVHMIEDYNSKQRLRFVAISSNSARVARTNSIPYCASKAALSMAVRCAARELARAGGPQVWGYEPGLLDTEMTRETTKRFSGTRDFAMHRMEGVGPEGIPPMHLADRIIGDLISKTVALNGCMIPFDGGEQ